MTAQAIELSRLKIALTQTQSAAITLGGLPDVINRQRAETLQELADSIEHDIAVLQSQQSGAEAEEEQK